MELTLESYTSGDFTVVQVSGEIDVYTAPKLRERLTGLSESGINRIVVDLSTVEFLDSTGLGVLVGALKRANAAGGALRLVCSTERILKIFRITGLQEIFHMASTVEEAIAE